MSPKNSLLKAGLTALGCLGIAATIVADPGAPTPPGRTASDAPAASNANTVLLLHDGRVLEGKLSEDASGYLVHVLGNIIPVKKHEVEGAFRNIREAYEFQAERLPDRDPDEQLRLARWCLTNHFNAEAKTHLQAVLALSPKHGPAMAMLDSLVKSEERAALRDPGVGRTNFEAGDDQPRELSASDLRKSRRLPGLANVNAGLPRIFDLPPPVAVKRANEFAQYVQPVLQVACAKCHNERYTGDFQLIEIKTRHDRTSDVYRANLDATLRLVDPDNPARSELLSSALRNHGNSKAKRPIFSGANDPYYQVLATWVNSLRTPKAREPVTQAGYVAPAEPEGEVFAVDRNGRGSMIAPNGPRPMPSASPGSPSDDKFPVPFMLGGPRPKLNLPTQPPATAPIPRPATLPVGPPQARPELPALPPDTESDDDIPLPKPAKAATAKPVKIDPALLQRALMNRYAPH